MRSVLLLSVAAMLAACDAPPPTEAAVTGTVQAVTLNAIYYDALFEAADGSGSGPRVTVTRQGGRFLAGDHDLALQVASKYCAGTGRRAVAAPQRDSFADGRWSFENLCA